MKNLSARILFILLAGFLILGFSPVMASTAPVAPADVTVRISRLQQILNTLQEMEKGLSAPPQQSPLTMLRGMLFGTDWIDPNRAIVFGMNFEENNPAAKPVMTLLVPFSRKNSDFKMAYQAIERKDHYVVPLPPGNTSPVPESLESALVDPMQTPLDRFLSVELSTENVMKKVDPQIQQLLSKLDQQMADSRSTAPQGSLTPEQIKQLFRNLIGIGAQIKTLSAGLDLTESNLVVFFQALAKPDSQIAEMMATDKEDVPSLLGNYEPAGYQIRMRTLPFDNAELLDFFNANFGQFYKALGIDIDQLRHLAQPFSGEMAGGLSFSPSAGLEMEMIMPVAPGKKLSADFIAKQYIPWLIEYGKNAGKIYQEVDPGIKFDSLFTIGEDTVIDGVRVSGVNGRMPIQLGTDSEEGGTVTLMPVRMRLAVMDDYLLMASDDERMGGLIDKMRSYKPAPETGPLVLTTLDIGAVTQSIARMASQDRPEPIPDFGLLTYTVDVKGQKMAAEYRIETDGIRSLINYVSRKTPEPGAAPAPARSDKTPAPAAKKSKAPVPETKASAPDWFEKGSLYATYGNEAAAVKSFQNAIEIDPDYTEAYFNLGVVYGDMGEYEKAIESINRAIASSPETGRYYYGRGWIHMRSGTTEQAMRDIRKAAYFGDPEAKRYLENIASRGD